jgi:hypothetical protein
MLSGQLLSRICDLPEDIPHEIFTCKLKHRVSLATMLLQKYVYRAIINPILEAMLSAQLTPNLRQREIRGTKARRSWTTSYGDGWSRYCSDRRRGRPPRHVADR